MGGVIGRITLFVLAGLLAGFLTWFVSDGSGFIHLSSSTGALSRGEFVSYEVIFVTWGASIAILLGLADMLAAGQNGHWPRVLIVGLGVGFLAGLLGGQLGMGVFGLM